MSRPSIKQSLRPEHVRLLSGVLAVLGAILPANAQSPTVQDQQGQARQQQTPAAPTPTESRQPIGQPPLEGPTSNDTALPPIDVRASRPKEKPKPKSNAGAPQRTAEQTNGPTAAQAALGAKM